MTEALQSCTVTCPYCGEHLDLLVDTSAGDQAYVEDCAVCCRPIECRLHVAGGDWQLVVHRDDD